MRKRIGFFIGVAVIGVAVVGIFATRTDCVRLTDEVRTPEVPLAPTAPPTDITLQDCAVDSVSTRPLDVATASEIAIAEGGAVVDARIAFRTSDPCVDQPVSVGLQLESR